MDRRKFLSLAALAGFGVASPVVFGRTRKGNHVYEPVALEPYAGTFFVLVHAGGGWDPTSLCDPKGRNSEDEVDPMNQSYFAADIEEAGNIRYAPLGTDDQPNAMRDFFTKHYERLLVINGINMRTNGHDGGTRHIASGRLAEGFPAFGALHSASRGRDLPMSYLSFGGYDETMGLVARTRSGNTNALARIAYPDRYNTDNELDTFHSSAANSLIKAAEEERYNKLRETERLPRTQHALDLLWSGKAGSEELKKLQQYLPELSNDGFQRQAQVALAAYKAGIATSVNMSIGGYDTHGNHDAAHIPRLINLLNGVDFIFEEAQRQGVWQNVVVFVGSDFGRTPGYNEGNGKDHWPISSAMLMGAGIQGNRVIGASDERHSARTVNPSNLQVDDGGIFVEPHHIHQDLRKLAGISDNELSRQFPILIPDDEQMTLFA
ncbi:MAG: DUF1501 domain-containing protein [Nannocystaceae bacterium]